MSKLLNAPVLADNLVDPLRAIQRWVYENLGILYPEHKLNLLEGRLIGLCRKVNLETIDDLYRTLAFQPGSGLDIDLAHAVSTNHTAFFREPETFRFFLESILPACIGPLRIWSAAASTGEESYTIAMLLVHQLGSAAAAERCSILGTDISAEVIAAAERGRYQNVAGVPEEYRRYLAGTPTGHVITPSVRRLCLFRRLNLIRQWPFQKQFHVIFCRNVLYYFDQAQQTSLLRRFYERAPDGGWLVTSVTESLRGLDLPWRMIRPGVYRKVQK